MLKHNIVILSNKIAKINIFGNFSKRREVYGYIFYNTLTRQKEKFIPIDKQEVRMYSCGPTVYKNATIGNIRTNIFQDVLRRVLRYNGYKIKHVMNITDVGHLVSDGDEGEDKMLKSAKEEHKTP